jgi:hypothetical protein
MEVKGLIRQLSKSGVADDVFRAFGLEAHNSALLRFIGGLGVFAAGAIVGTGIGVLLAPAPGVEMRAKARTRIDEMRSAAMRMGERISERAGKSEESLTP